MSNAFDSAMQAKKAKSRRERARLPASSFCGDKDTFKGLSEAEEIREDALD